MVVFLLDFNLKSPHKMSLSNYKLHELFASETLRSRLMDDEDLMKQVLDACLPDLQANGKIFSNQMEQGSFTEARRTIHSIKGSAQNSDLKVLAVLAGEIEESLREGRYDAACERRGELSKVVGDSVEAVEGYFLSKS